MRINVSLQTGAMPDAAIVVDAQMAALWVALLRQVVGQFPSVALEGSDDMLEALMMSYQGFPQFEALVSEFTNRLEGQIYCYAPHETRSESSETDSDDEPWKR